MSEVLRELTPADRPAAWALGTLAFGGDPAAAVPAAPAGARSWGVLVGDRLLAKATLRPYAQWWGGRPVPMAGVAGVAVHPDGRGRGTARQLVGSLVQQARAAGQPLSVLFATAPGIYRPLGWEVVGGLEETVLPLSALRDARASSALVADPAAPVTLRSAGPEDVGALAELWRAHGAATDGALTRDGASFPHGPQAVLERAVVTLALAGDEPVGYVAYDRGRGYAVSAELHVWELVARTPDAAAALLRSVGSWDAVAGTARWRGSTEALGRLLRVALPAPVARQPWLLRVTDAPGAVAARGWAPQVRTEAAFTLVDPLVPEHEGAWRLVVADGEGRLERGPAGAPRLHVRGLALLYAGAADTRALRTAGLLAGDVPGLDALVGPRPDLVDYF